MPKFIIKVYKMYRGQIYRYTYKRETFEEKVKARIQQESEDK